MEEIILISLIISYGILITMQVNLFKELLEIKRILWKVAENECTEFFFEKTDKKERR